MRWLVCAARLVYKSRLYRKTSAERLSLVQVSRIKPIIRPIPEDLSIKPRPETHFGAQARLVHHFVGSARQIHLGALFLFGQMTYIYIDKTELLYRPLTNSGKKSKAPRPQSILGRKLYREGKEIEQYSVIGR